MQRLKVIKPNERLLKKHNVNSEKDESEKKRRKDKCCDSYISGRFFFVRRNNV